jgi:hypothetical protein
MFADCDGIASPATFDEGRLVTPGASIESSLGMVVHKLFHVGLWDGPKDVGWF